MSKFPDTLTMISELIATPSVSSVEPQFDQGNRAVIERLAGWLEDGGFQVDVMEIPGFKDKANLIARLGDGDAGLVYAGHTDTVPYDDARWSQDPFRLTERDNRLYGLGTSDMKGFFALALEAVRGLSADLLLVLGFAFEADITEETKQYGRLTVQVSEVPHCS